MEDRFYYGQKVFYAKSFIDSVQSFEIKKIVESGKVLFLCEPDKNIGVEFCPENKTFTLSRWSEYYNRWNKEDGYPIAISLDENELLKILAKKNIEEEKQKIKNSQEAIAKSWALIVQSQKYL